MKIKNIIIQGYRSVKGPIKLELGNLNALIGSNNVGKSNILKVIWKMLGKDWVTVNSFNEEDVYYKNYDNDIEIVIEFDEPYRYYQYQNIEPIEIPKISFFYTRYKIGVNAGQRRLEKKCLQSDNAPVKILSKKPLKGEKRQYQPLTTIPQDLQNDLHIIFIGTNRNLKDQLPGARNSILEILLKDINNDFQDINNTMLVHNKSGEEIEIPRIDRFNQCIKSAIEALKTDEFNKLEKTIKENALRQLGINLEDDSEDFNVYFNPLTSLAFYNSLQLYVRENDFEINVTELGGGFQNALVIAILKAFEERKKSGALFLIEEPEMFLHPQMQRSLYQTIRNISLNNQVIYTTHSPNFLRADKFDEIYLVRKTKKDGTIINTANVEEFVDDLYERTGVLSESDQLYMHFKNAYENTGDSQKANEAFFAKKIILVEGQSESLVLPYFFDLIGFDYIKEGISIVRCGGKNEIDRFFRLYNEFGIPCYVIFDGDRQNENTKDEVSTKKKNKEIFDLFDLDKEWADDKVNDRYLGFEKRLEDSLGFPISDNIKSLALFKRVKEEINDVNDLPGWVSELVVKIKSLNESLNSVLKKRNLLF